MPAGTSIHHLLTHIQLDHSHVEGHYFMGISSTLRYCDVQYSLPCAAEKTLMILTKPAVQSPKVSPQGCRNGEFFLDCLPINSPIGHRKHKLLTGQFRVNLSIIATIQSAQFTRKLAPPSDSFDFPSPSKWCPEFSKPFGSI